MQTAISARTAREMSPAEYARRVGASQSASTDSVSKQKDSLVLMADLAGFERRVNDIANTLSEIADRMWGARLVANRHGEIAGALAEDNLSRLALACSNMRDTLDRLESEAARFERLA